MNLPLFAALSIFSAYMNDETITLKKYVTGNPLSYIDYNVVNTDHNDFGGQIRIVGIHDMWVEVEGFERIDLIKDDVCLQPNLFTILGYILPKNATLTQRWSCVKWFLPLTFAFKISDNKLDISSSVSKYRLFTLFRSHAHYTMTPITNKTLQNPNITVSVNGRTTVIHQKQMVQIYSTSALHPCAIITRILCL